MTDQEVMNEFTRLHREILAKNAEIARLTAALSRAEKALKEIDDLPSVQQDEGPMIARRALLSISEPVK